MSALLNGNARAVRLEVKSLARRVASLARTPDLLRAGDSDAGGVWLARNTLRFYL